MILRPYQERIVSAAIEALADHDNTLCVASTGSGKTVCLSELAKRFGGKQLVMQHRQELVAQNMTKFKAVNPGAKTGLWTADTKSFNTDTTFAMVQSLMGHVDQIPKLDLLIADEAHHCAAPSWLKIINAAKEKNPDIKIVGFTATPQRADWKGLRDVFSNVCATVSTSELIKLGFLVPYRTFVVDVGGSLERLQNLKGQSDFGEQSEVAEILDQDVVSDEVVRHWLEKAEGRPTVVFTSTVNHAQNIAASFNQNDIPARCVYAGMSAEERQYTLDLMTKGKIKVLSNAMLLTEGWDYPPVSCVILLRRCSAKSTMIQMAGRGLRIVRQEEYPGIVKKDCVILDFGASLITHKSLDADIDIDPHEKTGEAPTKECPECGTTIPAQCMECPICGHIFERKEKETVTEVELTEIDLLGASQWRYEDLWGNGSCLVATGFDSWAGIFSTDGENWYALGQMQKTEEHPRPRIETIYIGGRVQALAAADDYLRTHEQSKASKKNRRWLDDPATDRQMELLQPYGYNWRMGKYEAGCHLTFRFHQKQIEKALGVRP